MSQTLLRRRLLDVASRAARMTPHNHIEEILTRALDIALEEKDPQRKLERRWEREERKESHRPGEAHVSNGSCPGGGEARTVDAAANDTREEPAPSRHVPAAVRERVMERAGYQCEYRGPDGTRCTSRTGLQVEHTLPFAMYRTHDDWRDEEERQCPRVNRIGGL